MISSLTWLFFFFQLFIINFSGIPGSLCLYKPEGRYSTACWLGGMQLTLRGGGKISNKPNNIATQPLKQLLVKNFREDVDEEGQHVICLYVGDPSGAKCPQSELDDIVRNGHTMPALVFNSVEMANKFKAWQQSHTHMQLRSSDDETGMDIDAAMNTPRNIETGPHSPSNAVQEITRNFAADKQFYQAYDKLSVSQQAYVYSPPPQKAWKVYGLQIQLKS
jgi:hypothetical protein